MQLSVAGDLFASCRYRLWQFDLSNLWHPGFARAPGLPRLIRHPLSRTIHALVAENRRVRRPRLPLRPRMDPTPRLGARDRIRLRGSHQANHRRVVQNSLRVHHGNVARANRDRQMIPRCFRNRGMTRNRTPVPPSLRLQPTRRMMARKSRLHASEGQDAVASRAPSRATNPNRSSQRSHSLSSRATNLSRSRRQSHDLSSKATNASHSRRRSHGRLMTIR